MLFKDFVQILTISFVVCQYDPGLYQQNYDLPVVG